MFVLDSIPLMILLEVKLFVGRALARARGSRICGVEFRPIGIPSSERRYGLLRSSCYRIFIFHPGVGCPRAARVGFEFGRGQRSRAKAAPGYFG